MQTQIHNFADSAHKRLSQHFASRLYQDLLTRRSARSGIGRMIFPEVDSHHRAIAADDKAFIAFERKCRADLMNAQPVSESRNGLFFGPIATNWACASYLAGYLNSPMPYPLHDNDLLVAEMGLATQWRHTVDEDIYHTMLDLMFSRSHWAVEQVHVHVSKLADTGFPLGSPNDMQLKVDITTVTLHYFHDIVNLLRQFKFEEAARRFYAPALWRMGWRAQSSDTVVLTTDGRFEGKRRPVPDLQAALTGGRAGRMVDSDRSVTVEGIGRLADFVAQRLRNVWASPGFFTYPFTCWLAQVRNHYFNDFEFTWHHRGIADLEAKIRTKPYLISLDVTRYDSTFSRFVIGEFTRGLSRHLTNDALYLLKQSFHWPVAIPNADPSATGYSVMGDPNVFDESRFNALPSGTAINPDIGKLHMPAQLVIGLNELYGDIHTESQIQAFLRGEHPKVALLNAGDDCWLLASSEVEQQRVNALLSTMKTGWYFSVEPETAGTFLGFMATLDQGQVHVIPNIFSWYANWFMPERGVDSPSRRVHWATGWMSRNAYYQQSPAFSETYTIVDANFRQFFHSHLDEYAIVHGYSALREGVDQLVLDKPEVLYYRVNPAEVSPAVLDAYMSTIPEELVDLALKILVK